MFLFQQPKVEVRSSSPLPTLAPQIVQKTPPSPKKIVPTPPPSPMKRPQSPRPKTPQTPIERSPSPTLSKGTASNLLGSQENLVLTSDPSADANKAASSPPCLRPIRKIEDVKTIKRQPKTGWL